MRLNNKQSLRTLCQLGLPEPIFRDSKEILALGERLKDSEQSLKIDQWHTFQHVT